MQRNISLDILKIILAISVVFLHTHIFSDISALYSFLLVQGVFRLAVPIFLIITGYYFVKITSFSHFKKWLKRIFILYVVWMLFYSPIWWGNNFSYNLSTIYNGYFVLWYIISVLYGGSLLYFFRNLSFKWLLSLAIVLFVIGTSLQEVGNLHILNQNLDIELNQYQTHRNFLFMSFPFLTIGYLIHRHQNDNRLNINIFYVLGGLLLVVLESWLNYTYISHTESLDQMFSLFIVAPLIFLYVLNKKVMGNSKELANFSTAIFLIHPLFIFHFNRYFIGQETIFSFVVLLCSILAALVLIRINKKIKYIL